MFPIHHNRIYTVDIEVKPLPEFDKRSHISDEEIMLETPNFYPWASQIYCMSICWGPSFEEDTIFLEGEEIKEGIRVLSENKLKLGAHNVFFDWCNLYYHFELPLNFVADSGVVAQCVNNSDFITSFGLKQFTERTYNIETQDTEIKDYLKIHHKIPSSKYGEFIHLCPLELISKYCRLDAYYCWKILHDSKKWLISDIKPYMQLYMSEVKLTILQFIEGILINKDGFIAKKRIIENKINLIQNDFMTHESLQPHILKSQKKRFDKIQAKFKTKKLDFEIWNNDNPFNINSTKQLKELFDSQKLFWNEDKQKFEYPYVNFFSGTKINNPNSPKLGTKTLYAYGIGGEILADKNEQVTLASHIERALDESVLDGRIHPHINLLGTKSGRISASGVNIIATPIGEAEYGKNLIVEDGWVLVSRDFRALEPTIFACLSEDPLLMYTNYLGEGKTPYVESDVLWIDDNYLMAAYSAPFLRSEIENKLDLNNWVQNADTEKKKLKEIRSLSKSIVLSTNYGAGALKVQAKIREELKITIPLKNIQIFQESYWATISTASEYKRTLEKRAQERGYLINIGGFPLTFYDRPGGIIKGAHKALNRMLQSSANICMKLLLHYIYSQIRTRSDIVPLIADWHDCCFFKVREDIVQEYISITDKALAMVNQTLSLPLKLRLDLHIGRNFYETK